MKEFNSKKWCQISICTIVIILILIGVIVIYIDPYFHYHRPIDNLSYQMSLERYQNNGILKNFEYDAIIIGSSMTENFKTSEFDKLFDVNSIKVPYSGGSYKEINDELNIAVENNENIKVVFRCLDYLRIMDSADTVDYDLPEYMYDTNNLNDAGYLLNKEVLLGGVVNVIQDTMSGKDNTSFDDYSSWVEPSVLEDESEYIYLRSVKEEDKELTEEDIERIKENIQTNVIDFAINNPDIQIYLYLSPYSVIFWDACNQEGNIYRYIEAEKYVIEMMLPYDNIHLYSFNTMTNITCDLNNYTDYGHYNSEINSQILVMVKDGKGLLTKDNYIQYLENELEIYTLYDYEQLLSSTTLKWRYEKKESN